MGWGRVAILIELDDASTHRTHSPVETVVLIVAILIELDDASTLRE